MADPGTSAIDIALDVPYVTQTEALCGGAAAAMVLRYWGDRHAGVNRFRPLVDHRAGGIAANVLAEAIRQDGWRAVELSGSIDLLRQELTGGWPMVILLAEGRRRLHYVVVTAIGRDEARIHDPTWGASRRIALPELVKRWAPAGFWSLRILPAPHVADRIDGPDGVPLVDNAAPEPATACAALLSDAVDQVRRLGLASADAVFNDVRRQCPDSPGLIRELAGVRFAERKFNLAADLAAQAVALDPRDSYAWEVLASARFMRADAAGALVAWNHIGKPRVDSIHIEGLERTRYALIAQVLGVTTETVLTPEMFQLAERRLQELPDRSSARIGYRPQPDGFTIVDVALKERATRPRGRAEWAAEAVRTAVDREVRASVPGWSGQGELWTATWRWWSGRPRAALTFSAPRVGTLPGVWRVTASWEEQAYASLPGTSFFDFKEGRLHAGLAVTNWLTPHVRYELAGGLGSWSNVGRAASIGGSIEHRLFSDRLALSADATAWLPVTTQAAFRAGGARARFRSSREAAGTILAAEAGAEAVSSGAPLALWTGAGEGHARGPLLRAHRLLEDGRVAGPVFGRRVEYATVEGQRWLASPSPVAVGVAAFTDLAHASDRAWPALGEAFQIDLGVGLRVRIPGSAGTLRLDFARGIRDGSHAVTAGWQR